MQLCMRVELEPLEHVRVQEIAVNIEEVPLRPCAQEDLFDPRPANVTAEIHATPGATFDKGHQPVAGRETGTPHRIAGKQDTELHKWEFNCQFIKLVRVNAVVSTCYCNFGNTFLHEAS